MFHVDVQGIDLLLFRFHFLFKVNKGSADNVRIILNESTNDELHRFTFDLSH